MNNGSAPFLRSSQQARRLAHPPVRLPARLPACQPTKQAAEQASLVARKNEERGFEKFNIARSSFPNSTGWATTSWRCWAELGKRRHRLTRPGAKTESTNGRTADRPRGRGEARALWAENEGRAPSSFINSVTIIERSPLIACLNGYRGEPSVSEKADEEHSESRSRLSGLNRSAFSSLALRVACWYFRQSTPENDGDDGRISSSLDEKRTFRTREAMPRYGTREKLAGRKFYRSG